MKLTIKLAFWDNVLLTLLMLGGGLTTSNNNSIGAKQLGMAVMATANKMGNTAILSSSRTVGSTSVAKPVGLNSTPTIAPISKGTVIPTKNSSLTATPSYNTKYSPLSASTQEFKVTSSLEHISSDGVNYNVVGIYNKVTAMVLSESSANRGSGSGNILFPSELTASKNMFGRPTDRYNSFVFNSVVNKDQMSTMLNYARSNWKPFLFERAETTTSGKIITYLYSNIEGLSIPGITQLYHLPTPMINWSAIK